MKTLRWMSVGLLLAGLTTGCAKPPPPSPGSKISQLPANSLAVAWWANVPLNKGDSIKALYLIENNLFVYSNDNGVYTFQRNFGKFLNSSQPIEKGKLMYPPMALNKQVVYATATDLIIYSDAGERLRSMKVSRSIRTRPTGYGNYVYLASDYQDHARVLQYDVNASGAPIVWEAMTTSPMLSAPIFANGLLYFASTDGRVYALSEKRNLAWSVEGGYFQAEGAITADLRADNAGVYVASQDTKLYSLTPATGRIRWQYFAGLPLTKSPTPTADLIFQPLDGKRIACIDKINGDFNRKHRWVIEADQFLAADDRCAFFLRKSRTEEKRMLRGSIVTENNTIVAIDKKTGAEKFTSQRSDISVFASNIKDGVIYGATANGSVYAIRPVYKGGEMGELVMSPVEAKMLSTNP